MKGMQLRACIFRPTKTKGVTDSFAIATGRSFLTMSTPKLHQSAAKVWPLRLTTSGAMYSTVPQKEYAYRGIISPTVVLEGE